MKIRILVLVILFNIIVFSQSEVKTPEEVFIYRGIITLGGNISYSSTSYENQNNSSNIFSFTPAASYFLTDKFAAGLLVQYSHSSSGSISSDYWGIGPYARYYFSVNKFAPFITAGFLYGKNSLESEINLIPLIIGPQTFTSEFTSTKFDLGAGFDYFLVTNVALEFLLKYSYTIEKNTKIPVYIYRDFPGISLPPNEIKSSQILLAVGLNIFI